MAYALFREVSGEIHLRQFFVTRERRRQGVGRRAIAILFQELWSGKRRMVEVLCRNTAALSFWRAMEYNDCAMVLETFRNHEHRVLSVEISLRE